MVLISEILSQIPLFILVATEPKAVGTVELDDPFFLSSLGT